MEFLKIKYRILKKGCWFYPQYKKYGIWFNFKRPKPYINAFGTYRYAMFPDSKVSFDRAKLELQTRTQDLKIQFEYKES